MKIGNDVLAVLSVALVNGNKLILQGQLDRALYQRTDKALQAAGGKWDRKAKAHVFDGDAEERIEQMILTGQVEVPKDEFNYFPTQGFALEKTIEMADIKAGMMLLEPSAGQGHLVKAMYNAADDVMIDMYELNPVNCKHLESLALPRCLGGIYPEDFLQQKPTRLYDRIVMNPPFMKQADIKHINHALQFLKPTGLLTSVMASGVTFRENKLTKDFRDLVASRFGHFVPLPSGSFKASGTMVETVIVSIPGTEYDD